MNKQNIDFIEDYLSRKVRRDTERTNVKNITTQAYEYWYDPQEVSPDGSTMMPKKCHVIKAGEIAQFDRATAFDIGVKMSKDFAYKALGDKGLSVASNWKAYLYKIVFQVGTKLEEDNPVEEARQVIDGGAAVTEAQDIKQDAPATPDVSGLSYVELQKLYVSTTGQSANGIKKLDLLAHFQPKAA